MIDFEVRYPGNDKPIVAGTVHHFPREGETIILDNVVFVVDKLVWQFDQKFTTGAKIIVMLKTVSDDTVVWFTPKETS